MDIIPRDADALVTKDDLAGVEANIKTDAGRQIHDAVAAQTRTLLFGLVGAMATMTGLNLTAVALLA